MSLLGDFKKFLLRGNVVDLAVVMGPRLGWSSKPRRGPADPDNRVDLRAARFGTLSFTINSSHFFYGDFINSLITFVSVAGRLPIRVCRSVHVAFGRYSWSREAFCFEHHPDG